MAVPLFLCLLTGVSVSGCSAPTWEVRGGARRPPHCSPPAVGTAAAPRRAEPELLSWSPRQCRIHTGAGGRSGDEQRSGRRRRELGTARRSGLQSQLYCAAWRRPGCCCWVAKEGHLLVWGSRMRGSALRGGVEGWDQLHWWISGGGSAPGRLM